MADDKMGNQDLNKNMGGQQKPGDAGTGQQAPARNPNDDRATGQRSGGEHGEQRNIKDEGNAGKPEVDEGSRKI